MAILILEHSADCTAELLVNALRSFGQRLRFIKLHAGQEVPSDLDDVHGVVSLGGPQTVHLMDGPWMQAEMNLLRDAHGAGVPVLGLCLGAQLVAAALGGETAAMTKPEVGWKKVTLSAAGREDPLFAGQPWCVEQFCWHHDHVLKVPPGAMVLASSEACKVQAFSVGLRTYAMQYHAEWSCETVKHQTNTGANEVKAAGENSQTMLQDTERFGQTSERLAKRFFDSVSVLLMPVDRLNPGLVKDLRH